TVGIDLGYRNVLKIASRRTRIEPEFVQVLDDLATGGFFEDEFQNIQVEYLGEPFAIRWQLAQSAPEVCKPLPCSRTLRNLVKAVANGSLGDWHRARNLRTHS